MKKINFKNLSKDEILTKEQLKKVVGGDGSGGGSGKCRCTCTHPPMGVWLTDDCTEAVSYYCRDSVGGTPGPFTCESV